MQNNKHTIWVVLGLLLLLTGVVIVFPMISNDIKTYRLILCLSTGLVFLIMLILVFIHEFTTRQKKQEIQKKEPLELPG